MENIPMSGRRIEKNDLLVNITEALGSSSQVIECQDIFNELCVLNEQQKIVIFSDDTIAMTHYGELSLD
jgi:hypothetical protein